TWPGVGRIRGVTHFCAVTNHQRMPSPTKTATAIPTNSAAEMGLPSRPARRAANRGRGLLLSAFASGGCGIHESAVDQLGEIHVLRQQACLCGRGLYFRYDLVDEISRQFGLVLRQRIVGDAVETGRQFLRLRTDRLGDDGTALGGIGAVVGEPRLP